MQLSGVTSQISFPSQIMQLSSAFSGESFCFRFRFTAATAVATADVVVVAQRSLSNMNKIKLTA